jgi:GT2 family glycosyltransferase
LKPVSVVITTFNRKEKVIRTIQSVLDSCNYNLILEILVVDDASTDNTAETVEYYFHGLVRVIRLKEEKLISESRNIGFNESKGNLVFFLDDDVILSNTVILELSTYLLENPNVGCVMPTILYYDKPSIIWCGGIKHNFWTTHGKFMGNNEPFSSTKKGPIPSDSVITAFMVRKSPSINIKFHSDEFPIGWEDMDYAMTMKQSGYSVHVLPGEKVWHDFPTGRFIKNNRRLYFEIRNRLIFHKKWSANNSQYLSSVVFSLLTGLSYSLLSLYCGNANSFVTAFKAMRDGLNFRIARNSPI